MNLEISETKQLLERPSEDLWGVFSEKQKFP